MPRSGDNGGQPWFMRMVRPPTTEQKGFTPTTEVGILLLQGLALIGLLAVSSAFAFAALLAWDVSEQAVRVIAIAGGLVAVVLVVSPRLGGMEFNKAMGLLVVVCLGYLVSATALMETLSHTDGMDVEIVRALVVGLGGGMILVIGTMMVFAGHYKAAGWFSVIAAVAVGATWWLMPTWAESDVWPWALSGISSSFCFGAYWTARAFKTEIDDPMLRGMSGFDRAALEYVNSEFLNGGEEDALPNAGPVLINPRNDLRHKEARWQWERFLHYAYTDSSTPRLEKMGYPRRSRIEPWRDALMASGWAAWNDEQNHKLGWHLTAEVPEILEAFDFPGDEE